VVSPYCPKLPGHQGLQPQQCHRLVRLADSRCRKGPCSSRTNRCWSGRCRCCWPGYHWSCWFLRYCLFYCWFCRRLLRYRLFSDWLFGSGFLCCRLLRYRLFSGWLFGSGFLCCRLLRYRLFSGWLFGSGFLCCRLLRYRFFCGWLFSSGFLCCRLLHCWFSFLLCCHFNSPSMMKVNKYNTYDYCTYTFSPRSTTSKG
jgi:hypothetical protein